MDYNFDEVIDRTGTASLKWDETETLFGHKDILPMWVADMDFPVAQPIIDALKKRVEQGIYGYTLRPRSYLEATVDWMKKRHDWYIKKEWICQDRKSTRLNSSHVAISYAVF